MEISQDDRQVLNIFRGNMLTTIFFASNESREWVDIRNNDLFSELEKSSGDNFIKLKELCESLPEMVGTNDLLSVILLSTLLAVSSKNQELHTEQTVIYIALESITRYWRGSVPLGDVVKSLKKAYNLAVKMKQIKFTKGDEHGNG